MGELISFIKSRQPVNLIIVCINIAVFMILSLTGNPEDVEFMLEHGAEFAPYVIERQEYYRLVTCMFLHFGLEHLFYNMLVLIFLGDTLEKTAGKARYLLIYLGGGIAGNLLSVFLDVKKGEYAVSAGASGAVFAVIGALIYLVICNKGQLEELSGRRLILMAVLSVLQGMTSAGIDNEAHVGGLIAGFLLAFFAGSGRRLRVTGHRADSKDYERGV